MYKKLTNLDNHHNYIINNFVGLVFNVNLCVCMIVLLEFDYFIRVLMEHCKCVIKFGGLIK